ncbi:MAG: elongation factor P maturation arginine rhamnosyltransferase EarP [Thiobacillus sp.]|nr:elongation factor P maturation arginine rhamnosyltransferase EarP [Thiobacillus sp.]MDP2056800.1 elongation factor P maturation arginine rhamnosyltransferase EarP [Thiobacillus sp.]
MRTTWDIFCNVVDNYGDIGIAWRLARGLVNEHGLAVRLWVDDLHVFQRIWPAIDPNAAEQSCEGVTVCAWRAPFAATEPAQVVLEAFGCALPEAFLTAMSAQSPPPVWINLEYLSAEPWVAEHHGLPSPHPRLPLTKHFFFPGYTPDTGGLLAEADLAERRAAFVRAETPAFWRQFGLDTPHPDELRVSLFAYENPALPDLLDAWVADTRPVTCLVPEGRLIPQLADWLAVSSLPAGEVHRRGALRLHVLPFLNQDAYDHLLWACKLNFVRGEDSCVRAQWAARPLVWQAYPQVGNVHWDKVNALLVHYTEWLDRAAARAVTDIWQHWNGIPAADNMAACWAAWRAQQAAIEQHAGAWCDRLRLAGRLTDKLVDFAENKIKCRVFSNP